MGLFSDNTPSEIIPRHMHRKLALVCLFLFTLVFNWLANLSGVFEILEYRTDDLFFRLRNHIKMPSIPDYIVIVAIDEPSMQELDLQWPWPRKMHGDLISSLHEAGAAVIAFDIVFSEPEDAASDDYFAQIIESTGSVILAEDKQIVDENRYRYSTVIEPIPVLNKAAKRTGLVWIALDDDGFIRRIDFNQDKVSPFAQVLAEEYLISQGAYVDVADPVTTFNIPHDNAMMITINFLGAPRSIKTVSYYQAQQFKTWLPEGIFKDKIVLIGFNLAVSADQKVADHFSYPFLSMAQSQISGVEIHATLADTLLRERYLKPLPSSLQWLMFVVFLAAGAMLLWKLGHWKGAVIFTGGVSVFYAIQFSLFYHGQYLTNVITPVFALMLFLVTERIYSYAYVDREKRFIRKAFGYYLPPVIVDQLINDPSQLSLTGKSYDTTILFSDLVGFTSIAERMEPEALREMLTEYFGEMINAIMDQNGTLDKFIGDAVMCFFGVPIATPDHAHQGVLAAWNMMENLKKMNQIQVATHPPELKMRIGINSGRVIAGNYGARHVFNYTLVGDAVNLASRLESANKQYGTSMMMGESTYRLTGDKFDTRLLDRIRVKGKGQAVYVYELLGPEGTINQSKKEQIELYMSAFDHYSKDKFSLAIKLLDQSLEIGCDEPAQKLKERCERYLQSRPDDDWDGIYVMETK